MPKFLKFHKTPIYIPFIIYCVLVFLQLIPHIPTPIVTTLELNSSQGKHPRTDIKGRRLDASELCAAGYWLCVATVNAAALLLIWFTLPPSVREAVAGCLLDPYGLSEVCSRYSQPLCDIPSGIYTIIELAESALCSIVVIKLNLKIEEGDGRWLIDVNSRHKHTHTHMHHHKNGRISLGKTRRKNN